MTKKSMLGFEKLRMPMTIMELLHNRVKVQYYFTDLS